MSEVPVHGGGPRSFDDAWRGLRNRKKKVHQRNVQIKDLLFRNEKLESQLSQVQGELDSYSSCINGHKNPKWTCIQCGAETMTKALAERDALKVENERLRGALEKIAFGSLEKNFREITEMTDQQIASKALGK